MKITHQSGIVYAMTHPDQSGVKIGCVRSLNLENVRRRWKQNCGAMPVPFLLRRAIPMEDVRKGEKALQDIFNSTRIPNREWFNVEYKAVCAAMFYMSNGRQLKGTAKLIQEIKNEALGRGWRADKSREKAWDAYPLTEMRYPVPDLPKEELPTRERSRPAKRTVSLPAGGVKPPARQSGNSREERIAAGMCIGCPSHDIKPATPGMKKCDACREIAREKSRSRREKIRQQASHKPDGLDPPTETMQ